LLTQAGFDFYKTNPIKQTAKPASKPIALLPVTRQVTNQVSTTDALTATHNSPQLSLYLQTEFEGNPRRDQPSPSRNGEVQERNQWPQEQKQEPES
jgi:hypothetical protein